jgi:poly(3-hydroxybutyrate) depolymerase
MITVAGQQVQIWTGPANTKGPMVFYWHGTGSSSTEAQTGLGPGFAEIQSSGGVIASFTTTTMMGMNTGNNVWYTGDFAMADTILACAVKQGLVDPRQVFTAGCSAGGLQVGAMVFQRSSYLAAAMPNSGGTTFSYTMQDAHVPAMCSTHGGTSDVVIISFPDATKTMNTALRAKGGFVVNCDHGGGHCQSPAPVKAAQWKFLKAHPFGVSPEPYAGGLPADFPTTCTIVP